MLNKFGLIISLVYLRTYIAVIGVLTPFAYRISGISNTDINHS